jgi:hypothetical protein
VKPQINQINTDDLAAHPSGRTHVTREVEILDFGLRILDGKHRWSGSAPI